jgi:hypothetical protein
MRPSRFERAAQFVRHRQLADGLGRGEDQSLSPAEGGRFATLGRAVHPTGARPGGANAQGRGVCLSPVTVRIA